MIFIMYSKKFGIVTIVTNSKEEAIKILKYQEEKEILDIYC